MFPIRLTKISPSEVLRVENLHKEYTTGRGRLVLFEDISFSVAQGDLMAIVGESGAGKSTLLHILGALDSATSGDVYFASTLLKFTSPRQAADFRNREVGYVWQFHYLLPEFTAQENVAMPLLARGEPRKSAMAKGETVAPRSRTGRSRRASFRRTIGRRTAARLPRAGPDHSTEGAARR